MKVRKNRSFGQLYVEWSTENVRIPTIYVQTFLDLCEVSTTDRTALDAGQEITINRPFNLAQKYGG